MEDGDLCTVYHHTKFNLILIESNVDETVEVYEPGPTDICEHKPQPGEHLHVGALIHTADSIDDAMDWVIQTRSVNVLN